MTQQNNIAFPSQTLFIFAVEVALAVAWRDSLMSFFAGAQLVFLTDEIQQWIENR